MKKITALFLLIMCFCAAQAQNNPQHGWHTYCTNEFNNAIGGPVPFTIATCYPPDMAINYAGTAITKVAMYSDTLYNAVGGIYTCSIYVGGDSPYDGILASTITVDVPQSLGDWAEFDLDTPVWVTGNLPIWVVWETVQQLTAWPMGVCEGNDPSGDGHWIWGGHQWEHSNYGDWTVKTYFSWDEPQPQVPDVYFTGNNNGIGKIWKNDMLVQSISDTVLVDLTSLQVAPDGTVYSAGYSHDSTYDFLHGRIWLNDSILFNADDNTAINQLVLNGNQWTAAGFGENIWEGVDGLVWQDGEVLYAYGDSISNNQIVALAIDTLTGDIYTGGVTGESNPLAAVWKNDTLLWSAEWLSEVRDIAFDGTDLYAAGSLYFEGIRATLWQNDSIIFQISADDSEFSAIALYDGSFYLGGYKDDTLFVWQDGEVLYSHPFAEYSSINAMVVNEFGVYYAGQIDGMATVWKDGEVLYQPEGCDNITSLAVLPPEPTPEYTITLESADPDWGSVVGGGTYPEGSSVPLYAFPNIGCEFLGWNDSVTDNPRNIIVTQDSTFVASFGRIEYTIGVQSENPEWGSVSGGGTFYYGDTTEIAATPFYGYIFSRWTDSNTDNPRTVVVTGNRVYRAIFKKQSFTIITVVNPENAGHVSGGGTYDYGDIITLTAHNNPGYVFSQWEDGVTDNPREILVEGNAVYKALFNILQYEITTDVNPAEGGTVTGGGIYDYGSTATLTAIPNEGYVFLFWNDYSGANPRYITVTGNATYTATFMQSGTPTYTVTVLSNNVLLGSVTGGGEYPQGTTIEISAIPSAVATFTGWDDGNTDNPRQVVVDHDMTFTALFEIAQETYEIDVVSGDPLLGRVYGGGTFAANTTITIGATPYAGNYFTGWQDGNTDNPREILVIGNATYTAHFAQEPVQTYTLTVQYDAEQGYVIGGGNYVAGSTATLAAIANDGYNFVKWGDDNTDNPREILIDRDITLAAFFNFTDVEEHCGTSFNLYPSPANDNIRIEGLEGTAEICIYSATGVCVKRLTVNDNDEISVIDLPAGLYLVRINGRQTVKFVKR